LSAADEWRNAVSRLSRFPFAYSLPLPGFLIIPVTAGIPTNNNKPTENKNYQKNKGLVEAEVTSALTFGAFL